jgi:hypothetical protein
MDRIASERSDNEIDDRDAKTSATSQAFKIYRPLSSSKLSKPKLVQIRLGLKCYRYYQDDSLDIETCWIETLADVEKDTYHCPRIAGHCP